MTGSWGGTTVVATDLGVRYFFLLWIYLEETCCGYLLWHLGYDWNLVGRFLCLTHLNGRVLDLFLVLIVFTKKKLRVYIQCCIPRVAIKGWSNKYIVLQVFASKQNTCHDKFSQQEKVCLETLSVHHKACIFFSFLQPVKPNGIFCIYSVAGIFRGTHSRVAERTRLFPVREYSGKY